MSALQLCGRKMKSGKWAKSVSSADIQSPSAHGKEKKSCKKFEKLF